MAAIATTSMPAFVSTSDRALIEARVLGTFEVVAAGRRLGHADWQRVSAERIVKLLLVTPGHSLSRERAATLLWPDADPESSRASLRKAWHFAGRAVGPGQALTAMDGRIGLVGDQLDLDLDRLRAAFDLLAGPSPAASRRLEDPCDSARAAAIEHAVEVILELGHRELLPDDPYEDWVAVPREYLRSRWQGVAIIVARQAQAFGRVAEARAIADQLLDDDPADEAAHRLIIELLAAEGRHHAARRQFELCRRALHDAVDAEPSPETIDTFRAAERSAGLATPTPSTAPRLIARQAELARIEIVLDRVVGGNVDSLVIRGPAGIGKTRLLHEVAAYAGAAGWQVLRWQSVESASRAAYAPLRLMHTVGLTAAEVETWNEPARSAMATVAPGIGVSALVPFLDRSALIDALVLAMECAARGRPLLLAIDDIPWLDGSTLEILQRLLAGLARARILIAVTCRDDESIPDAAAALVEQIRRTGGLDLPLRPLAAADMESLIVVNLGGRSVQPELAKRAYEQTNGNPLFCLELMRTGRDGGTVSLVGDRWTSTAQTGTTPLSEPPDSVRRLVAGRSARLAGPTLDLVVIAAELGSDFSFETLEALVPPFEGGLVAALDRAMAAGLLIERGGGYGFAHPLYRLAVRGSSGSARRAGVHLNIARVIGGCHPDDPPGQLVDAAAGCTDVATAADHALTAAELGAAGSLPLAVAFGFAAADRAVRLFDPSAASLLERSLAAWTRLPAEIANQFDASAGHASLADLRLREGNESAADESFRRAIAAARTPDELARVYGAFFWLPYRHGDFEGTLSLLEEGFACLPPDAVVARANLNRWVGWILGRLQRYDESIERLSDAVRVLEAAGAPRDAMNALDQLGIMLEMVRRSDEAIDLLERSLAIALDLNDIRGETVRMHLGTALTRSGRPGRARPHIARALEVTHQMGDRYLEAVTAWAAAEMEDALGDVTAATEMRRRELALLASIGGNPHNEALAHAHLAHLARRTGDDATFAVEAAEARRLAEASPHPGYGARIEEALEIASWSELETG